MTRSSRLAIFVVFCVNLAVSRLARAQEAPVMVAGSEYGFEVGNLLPNRVRGMREIMPLWGLHYDMKVGPGLIEPGFLTGNAHGTSYTMASVAYRLDFDVKAALAFASLGPALHYYSPRDNTDRISVLGGVVQVGAMMPVSANLFLDANFRFYLSPATSLYFGFGVVVRFADGGG